MNVHIKPQIITDGGKPAFAVIPWDEYLSLINSKDTKTGSDLLFPNDVVKANARGDSLIKAWREYSGLTQNQLADKIGMKQPALARIENGRGTPRLKTLHKIAEALGISIDLLID